jgi:hypothetical protein
MIHGGWKAPSNQSQRGISSLTTEAQNSLSSKSSSKSSSKNSPVLAGMDKEEALAFVSRLFDAALHPCIWDRPQPMLAAPARSPGTDFESALTPPLLQAGGNVQRDNLI